MKPFLFALVSRDRVFGGDAVALVLVRFPSRGTGEAMKMQMYDVGRHGAAGAGHLCTMRVVIEPPVMLIS